MTTGPTTQELLDRFAPVFAEISAGAVSRERDRLLPTAEVDALRTAGFGAVRLPVELGGHGATFPQLIELLVELGRADSNLPQLLRGHVAFVELVLCGGDQSVVAPRRAFWRDQLAQGALVGNAQSERSSASFWDADTSITANHGDWIIDGRKYYSTGSLFADWIYASGRSGEDYAVAVVPTASEAVTRLDDWDGFGQRLTGSGTTVFETVPLRHDHVAVHPGEHPRTTQHAIFQLVLLATLAGIGQRAVDDTVAFVRSRKRSAFTALTPVPREDPQVQQVVGELAGLSFAATATVHAAAGRVAAALALEQRGVATAADYADADIAVYGAQGTVVDQVLRLTTDLFRVGGASATAGELALDRHWRNARTVACHNPEIFRARIVGDHALNGVAPSVGPVSTVGPPAT